MTEYTLRVPTAMCGDAIGLVEVSEAMARHAATGYGALPLHGPTLKSLRLTHTKSLLSAARAGRLLVCNQAGYQGTVDEIIDAAKNSGDLSEGTTETDWDMTYFLSLYVRKQHLIEWGNANGDVFHIVDAPVIVTEFGPKDEYGDFAYRGMIKKDELIKAAPVISQSGNGQLTVLIDGREALPVRAIPHVTGWIFHPDKIVFCLKSSSKTRLPSLSEEPHLSKNKKRIYKHEAGATLTAYHIPGNEPVQMKPLEWRGVEVQLKGLESELKLKYGEEGRGNDIGCAEWERATVPVLPAGAFVWLDDFKKFRHWTFNKGDSPDATELMLTPCLDADIRAMVMEGFEERKTATKQEPVAATAKAEANITIHNNISLQVTTTAPAAVEQAASGTNGEAALGAKVGAGTDTLKGLAAFRAIKNLNAGKLSIAFVGDKPKSEYGLETNNRLKIYVDKNEFEFTFSDLELLDKGTRSTLNKQGRMLLNFARGRRLQNTPATEKTVSVLRTKMFFEHLGIKDPFDPKDARWQARFKIEDKRGAADERAKSDAINKTNSYDQRNESGEKACDTSQTRQTSEEEYPIYDEGEKDEANKDAIAMSENFLKEANS